MRHILNSGISVTVRKRFVGAAEDVAADLVAVEFYPNSVPTFTIRSASGHIFAYLPPHAFGFASDQDLAELVDIECPDEAPSTFVMPIGEGGFGRIGETVIQWKHHICSADWAEANILIHCVMLHDGSLAFLRNSRFQIGGSSWNPPDWKKLRNDWRISNRDVCMILKKGDQYLAVARNPEGTTWGLPAGKIDPYETPEIAAERELMEETGLHLDFPILLDEREWKGRYIFCYLAEWSGTLADDITLEQREEWIARWVDKSVLFTGEFGDYNEMIFREYQAELERLGSGN